MNVLFRKERELREEDVVSSDFIVEVCLTIP